MNETTTAPAAGVQAQAGAVLTAWRASGADRVDPVRFGFIEALARRVAAHQGAARRVLDTKLEGLLAAYADSIERAGHHRATVPPHVANAGPPAGPKLAAAPHPRPGALAALLGDIARRQEAEKPLMQDAAAVDSPAAPGLTRPPELKALSQFKATWSKLSAERRLKQSLAKVPGNAGPLNSQQLVHRALVTMRDLSPDYLRQFMSYVDTLSWMEDLQGGGNAGIGQPQQATAQRPQARSQPATRGKAG